MPAYNFSWWYSLYFITYIIINTYIFMSVFLAVVYNNYRKHLKVPCVSGRGLGAGGQASGPDPLAERLANADAQYMKVSFFFSLWPI